MSRHLALLFVLATPVTCLNLESATSLVESIGEQDAKTRPVAKVIGLLKDMQAELQKELEDDKAVYEILSCWCKTNEQEKTKAIELGQSKIESLEADIGEAAAKIQELKATLKEAKDKINKDFAAGQKAASMRMKENKEFHAEETDLIEAIKACEQAIVVLSKHNPSMAQLAGIGKGLEGIAHGMMLPHFLNSIQVASLRTFVRQAQHPDSFLSTKSLAVPGYESGSGQIFGILKQMKEEFEANLAESRKLEEKNVADYEKMKEAKAEEEAATRKLIQESDAALAEFQEKHAQAMEELEDTEDQLALDQEFLVNLKKKCAEGDKEFAERLKSRMAEIGAVTDTIAFLNSDEAHSMFDKTVNTAFVQVAQLKKENHVRKRAAAVLGKIDNPQIALIATAVKFDGIRKVVEMIEAMIVELKDQQGDEVKQRDYCIAELDKNTREMDAEYDKRDQLTAQIDDLTETIRKLTEDIKTTKSEIAEMQTQMKRASENREAENADFQQAVMDQRVTQQILQKALERMKSVYLFLQQPGGPHTATSATDTDPGSGPVRFANNKEKNAGGGKVVAMIEDIISDSKKLEADAIRAESDGQTAYESFMQDSNKSIKKGQDAISNMTEEKAKSEMELNLAKTDLDGTNKQINNLHTIGEDLHKECDFLLKNFEKRQKARAHEIDALGEAKAILSGMQ